VTDIHIFWEQACGETLGKPVKRLIQKGFSCSSRAGAKNRQGERRSFYGRPARAIHIFWWQACGEGLDKPFKRLISNNFSLMQQSSAKAWKPTRILSRRHIPRIGKMHFTGLWRISTFFGSKPVDNALATRSSPWFTRIFHARRSPWQRTGIGRQARWGLAFGEISPYFGGKPVDKGWTSDSTHW